MGYPFHTIEPKWQKFWDEQATFEVELDTTKPKFYCLDMFPYPSGAGLHVGHPEGYTATDIMSRYKRMRGFNVLHPMGWDAFGHPAERYAIKTGTHPKITTQSNIATFRRQIKRLGFSYDWAREIDTTDPQYYRWTQWIFLRLYKKGLAYLKEAPVNWCPECKIVMANEEVDAVGKCEQGHMVVRRPMKQWMLKITAYAERLLAGLDEVDWPESIKKLQRDWVGRSEGAEVDFELTGEAHARARQQGADVCIKVFTTRPDTLFGATYMVIAPEHPLVDSITSDDARQAVKNYCTEASRKSDLLRTDLAKEKSGVCTGACAINPVNNKPIPIWVADYVLMSYGTGAIMAVPAHDARDFAFAKQYDLPVNCIIDPNITAAHKDALADCSLPVRQVEAAFKGDDESIAMVREAICSGNACWTGGGVLINSASDECEISINDLTVQDAKKKITAWLEEKGRGQGAVNYKLRDWLFSRQRYWGEPFPVLYAEDGSITLLEEDELPVTLPEVKSFQPSETGESPLAQAVDWLEVTIDGKKFRRETHTMPQWAGSCWYYLRFTDAHNTQAPWSTEAEKYWMPVDLYIGGAEHAVLHLLYSRFWHKVLYDLGLVSTDEPFKKLFNQGMILSFAYQDADGRYVNTADVVSIDGKPCHKDTKEPLNETVEKMSKSLGNVINPDDVVNEYGADAFRLYEMFLGPLEKTKPWSTKGIEGVSRFLQRAWNVVVADDGTCSGKIGEHPIPDVLARQVHKTIKGVTDDIEQLRFNTAISKLMVLLNALVNCKTIPQRVIETFVLLLSPFAPHMAEELWARLGNEPSVQQQPWPEYKEEYLREETVTIIVQINGKVRARMNCAADISKEDLREQALASDDIKKRLAGKTVKEVIVVPGRLVNIVV